jgi:hypothetical protein
MRHPRAPGSQTLHSFAGISKGGDHESRIAHGLWHSRGGVFTCDFRESTGEGAECYVPRTTRLRAILVGPEADRRPS